MKYLTYGTMMAATAGAIVWASIYIPSHITYEQNDVVNSLTASTPPTKIPEATLLFVGDIMLARGIEQTIHARDNDVRFPFSALRDITMRADLSVANLESVISLRGKNMGSIYSFRADPEVVHGLIYAGIDAVTLANNHAGDYGPDALTDTIRLLASVGVGTVGAGEDMTKARAPLRIDTNGIKISFLAATPLAPQWLMHASSSPAVAPLNERTMKEDIIHAHATGDTVVVLVHWGDEYETKHNETQERLARSFIDAGATLVIGHHPHVVQEVERYKNGVIAYSLGNFIFDQNFSEDTSHGLMLQVRLLGGEVVEVQEIPISFSAGYQPTTSY